MNQYDRVHRVILADGVTSFETAVYGLGRRWPDAWTSGADRLAPSAPLRSAADPWATGGGLAELRRQGHVQIYLTRWKIEETFCFLKQSYHL